MPNEYGLYELILFKRKTQRLKKQDTFKKYTTTYDLSFMAAYQYISITFVMRKKAFNKAFANSYVKYRKKNSGGHLVLLDK